MEYYTIILREDGQPQKNSWSEELELEWGGYSRVEHVERVENAEPRQIRRAGDYSGASLLSRSAKAFSMLSTWYSSYMPMA